MKPLATFFAIATASVATTCALMYFTSDQANAGTVSYVDNDTAFLSEVGDIYCDGEMASFAGQFDTQEFIVVCDDYLTVFDETSQTYFNYPHFDGRGSVSFEGREGCQANMNFNYFTFTTYCPSEQSAPNVFQVIGGSFIESGFWFGEL